MADGGGNGNGNGLARWQVWLAAAALALTFFGVVVVPMIGLFIVASGASSETAELKSRVDRMEVQIGVESIEIAQMRSSLVEIETQFRASDQVRNLMHANDLRIQSLLWKKSFGVDYPTGNSYYPTIAQDHQQ